MRAIFLATALVVSMAPLAAQDSAAKVIYQTGQVSLANGGYFKALSVGDPVKAQQMIVTGPDGYARFEVSDGSTFEVFPNSKVVFRETPGNWQHLLNVWFGRVKVLIQHAPGVPNPNQVTSPTAVISVRGTVFDVVVEDAEGTTFVTVDEGEVAVRNMTAPGDSAVLHAGDSIRVSPGVPLLARQIDKGNIVRNALRYARDVYYNAKFNGPRWRRSGGHGSGHERRRSGRQRQGRYHQRSRRSSGGSRRSPGCAWCSPRCSWRQLTSYRAYARRGSRVRLFPFREAVGARVRMGLREPEPLLLHPTRPVTFWAFLYEHIDMRYLGRFLGLSALGAVSILPMFAEGSCWLRDAAAPAGTTAYVLCEQGLLWVTTDGGVKWTSRNTGAKQPLRAMAFLDGNRGIAVGDVGLVLGSDDAGKTWAPRTSGITEKLMDVTFIGNEGWASGMNGAVIHTADGGRTWDKQKTGTNQALEGLFFLDAQHGWAVGWAGTIMRTADGGKTWQSIKADEAQWSLSSVYFKDDKTGWAVGFAGQILYSVDGGLKWKVIKSPANGWLTSIAFDKSNHGWITYDDGFLTSEDGGLTWKPVQTDGRYFLARLLRMNDTLWAIGQSVILRQNGAAGWKRIDTLVPNTAMQGAQMETSK